MAELETWELWYPDAASTGLLLARARIAPTGVVWAHAVPPSLDVTVRAADEGVLARGEQLRRRGERLPLTRLERQGARIAREDRWPNDADLGAVVILPGGEAGVLKAWWNAPDGSAWRWQVEF